MLDDERFMKLAFGLARKAVDHGEVPVGAVVVDPRISRVIGRGHNLMIAQHDPTAHAEIVALRRAARRVGNYRLTGVTLYVTLEPCVLCLGAIAHARIGRVVYAADDSKRGAIAVGRTGPVAALLHHRFEVTSGVMREDGERLLKEFFKPRR